MYFCQKDAGATRWLWAKGTGGTDKTWPVTNRSTFMHFDDWTITQLDDYTILNTSNNFKNQRKMKNICKQVKGAAMIMFISIASFMTMGACTFIDPIQGSGNIVSEVHDLSGFDAISAGGASDVQVALGDDWHVELITDDNLHEYVELSIENRTLRIRNREMVNLRPTDKVLIRVVMPAINDITASGASTVMVESEIAQSELSVSASGSSDVHINVNLDRISVRCSGSSDIHISGYAGYANVSASGSSDFRGKEFSCDVAEVSLSGSSDMYAIIREEVSGNLSGSSDLHISGSPVIRVSTSGSSDIKSF
jgi:hypothetical protein